MKRILSIICFSVSSLFMTATSEFVPFSPIFLQVRLIDPTIGQIPYPKSPVVPPSIGINDHTLFIYSGCDDATLQIVDTDDMVVCSEEITDSTSEITLPDTLSGEYELQLLQGIYCFYTIIELQ
ncbi:MAG: hypothetical protein IJ537_07635 [Bacteroidaceae bacterium]|nr:hypothetical protein [Bacteroidaceae bacterium]MBQ8455192.1 hypothetical protein [Bacteroidaceae bacterium]